MKLELTAKILNVRYMKMNRFDAGLMLYFMFYHYLELQINKH